MTLFFFVHALAYSGALEDRYNLDVVEYQKIKTSGVSNLIVPDSAVSIEQNCLITPDRSNPALTCAAIGARPSYPIPRSNDACMRMAFHNLGEGYQHKGLCWWFTEYQMNAWTFAVFAPEKPRPTPQRLRQLLNDLQTGKRIVEFPGYYNWAELSWVARDILVRLMANEQTNDVYDPEVWQVWGHKQNTQQENFSFSRYLERQVNAGFPAFVYLKWGDSAYHAMVAHRTARDKNTLGLKLWDPNYPMNFDNGQQSWFGVVETSASTASVIDGPQTVFQGMVRAWMPGKTSLADRYQRAWRNYCN